MVQETRIPQYRKLYEILRKHILSGVYEEGSLLPSENELCAVHSMTRPTVRHALEALVQDGFIYKKQGKGSIVQKPPQDIGILSISGTSSAIGKQYLQTQILQKPTIKAWPAPFNFDLSEAEKDFGCIYMERLRFVNEQAVFYDINPIPMKYMMKKIGIMPENEHRLPLVAATPELERRLDGVLAKAGLI